MLQSLVDIRSGAVTMIALLKVHALESTIRSTFVNMSNSIQSFDSKCITETDQGTNLLVLKNLIGIKLDCGDSIGEITRNDLIILCEGIIACIPITD